MSENNEQNSVLSENFDDIKKWKYLNSLTYNIGSNHIADHYAQKYLYSDRTNLFSYFFLRKHTDGVYNYDLSIEESFECTLSMDVIIHLKNGNILSVLPGDDNETWEYQAFVVVHIDGELFVEYYDLEDISENNAIKHRCALLGIIKLSEISHIQIDNF